MLGRGLYSFFVWYIYSSKLFSALFFFCSTWFLYCFLIHPSPSQSCLSHCMCPLIPPVFERKVLTETRSVIKPALQLGNVVSLCWREQWRPTKVHYNSPIKTDWAQDGGLCMLLSGLAWPSPYAFNIGTDVVHTPWTHTLHIPSFCTPHCLQPCCPELCLVGRYWKQI